ncbi:sphingomyelin phosphodiesterase 2 isoform X2 [Protopterus annectens]|uniref:sphingomyelin phosphodiesterase 2 isoform X2 n=1 Tax=Protopterus annectens TaxID=7888 RepID=UPI001CFB4DE4|nr:sphingomyelin phosphodiesterase 2 isoform X2 [Protopterus annectens]
MSSSPEVKLRVLTLNCWGIRYMSKFCQERYEMIGDLLCEEKHDVVLLQELQHGDWFGGKSVGLIILDINGLVVNAYVTHLHAEYCRENDSYLPHRLFQSWELAQFVRHTSKSADVVILGGDLNMHPSDLGCRLLCSYTGLKDAFCEAESFEGCEGGSTLIPENCFTSKEELCQFPQGIRIDYILYKGSASCSVKCKHLQSTKGSVPGKTFPYSDHEVVTAALCVQQKERNTRTESNHSEDVNLELVNILNECRTEIKVGVHSAEQMRYSTGRMGILGLVLMFLELVIALVPFVIMETEHTFPRLSFQLLAVLAFTVLLVTGVLYVFHAIEVKVLQGTEDQMRLRVQALQEQVNQCQDSTL